MNIYWKKQKRQDLSVICLNKNDKYEQIYFTSNIYEKYICVCSSTKTIEPIALELGELGVLISVDNRIFLISKNVEVVWELKFPYVVNFFKNTPNDRVLVISECAVYLITTSGEIRAEWEFDIITDWEFDEKRMELTIWQDFKDDKGVKKLQIAEKF